MGHIETYTEELKFSDIDFSKKVESTEQSPSLMEVMVYVTNLSISLALLNRIESYYIYFDLLIVLSY